MNAPVCEWSFDWRSWWKSKSIISSRKRGNLVYPKMIKKTQSPYLMLAWISCWTNGQIHGEFIRRCNECMLGVSQSVCEESMNLWASIRSSLMSGVLAMILKCRAFSLYQVEREIHKYVSRHLQVFVFDIYVYIKLNLLLNQRTVAITFSLMMMSRGSHVRLKTERCLSRWEQVNAVLYRTPPQMMAATFKWIISNTFHSMTGSPWNKLPLNLLNIMDVFYVLVSVTHSHAGFFWEGKILWV